MDDRERAIWDLEHGTHEQEADAIEFLADYGDPAENLKVVTTHLQTRDVRVKGSKSMISAMCDAIGAIIRRMT